MDDESEEKVLEKMETYRKCEHKIRPSRLKFLGHNAIRRSGKFDTPDILKGSGTAGKIE